MFHTFLYIYFKKNFIFLKYFVNAYISVNKKQYQKFYNE